VLWIIIQCFVDYMSVPVSPLGLLAEYVVFLENWLCTTQRSKLVVLWCRRIRQNVRFGLSRGITVIL